MTTPAKRFEVLDSLPAYGPMYVPVTDNGEPFYSEGFPVRFRKANGTDWVANFSLGWTNFNAVFDFPLRNKTIVFAGGQGYIMSVESERPLNTFGLTINEVLQTESGSLICADGTSIMILDNEMDELWQSERISWDGMKDLKLRENVLSGLSYDPTDPKHEWVEFTLNILSKELTGGSYRIFLAENSTAPKVNLLGDDKSKPWWRIWS